MAAGNKKPPLHMLSTKQRLSYNLMRQMKTAGALCSNDATLVMIASSTWWPHCVSNIWVYLMVLLYACLLPSRTWSTQYVLFTVTPISRTEDTYGSCHSTEAGRAMEADLCYGQLSAHLS
jgi:hypothetical protein